MKLKILVAIAALASALPAASATPDHGVPATAFIDWSSFSWTFDSLVVSGPPITPGLLWNDSSQTTSVNANSNPGPGLSPGWSTPINATDGVVSATADATALLAEFSGVPPDLNSSASVFRKGSFTLTPRTIVTFSVKATTYIYMDIPLNGEAYAEASLEVKRPGSSGSYQDKSLSTASGLENTPEYDSTTLTATFVNLTDSDLGGTLTAYAGVYKNGLIPAIPEPGTYAMLLAGLGVLVLAARRKELSGVSA